MLTSDMIIKYCSFCNRNTYWKNDVCVGCKEIKEIAKLESESLRELWREYTS